MSARGSTPASLARGDEGRRDGVARVDEGRDEHEIFALLLLADVYARDTSVSPRRTIAKVGRMGRWPWAAGRRVSMVSPPCTEPGNLWKGICGMDNHVTSILKRLDECEHD
jgi:hypothetical protein